MKSSRIGQIIGKKILFLFIGFKDKLLKIAILNLNVVVTSLHFLPAAWIKLFNRPNQIIWVTIYLIFYAYGIIFLFCLFEIFVLQGKHISMC